uniref:Uncharacterized protein n=1 Tax=viral metagenome TaxID=1070528 RepID=A0A6C0BMI8_9ZZZZ
MWCFKDRATYYPFPGAEQWVPPRKRHERTIFPWGGFAQRHSRFLGDGSGPLEGTVQHVHHHSITRGGCEKCVFEFTPRPDPQEANGGPVVFAYSLKRDHGTLSISDVYLSTRLEDFQRAFPELNLRPRST